MAAVQGIIATGLSGKLGNLVFYQMNGKTYSRTLPGKRTTPGKPKQIMQRKRFGEMIRFSRQFKFVVIPQIWNMASPTSHGFQLFMKTNKEAFGPEGQVDDLKKIKLSIGKLLLPLELTAQRQAPQSSMIDVSWLKDPYLSSVPYWDKLMAISSGEGHYSEIIATDISRGDNQGTFELPALPCPATHLFLFFSSLDGRKYSESVCFEI